jgi:hypothetical protein
MLAEGGSDRRQATLAQASLLLSSLALGGGGVFPPLAPAQAAVAKLEPLVPPPLVKYEDPEGLFTLRIPEGWFTKRCVTLLVLFRVFVCVGGGGAGTFDCPSPIQTHDLGIDRPITRRHPLTKPTNNNPPNRHHHQSTTTTKTPQQEPQGPERGGGPLHLG